MSAWLPITREEMLRLGWDRPDVVIVSGDAYVDHPAFGPAVIARLIESRGYRVAVLPQPNWRDDLRDFRKFGEPRLFFGVSAGNMDSMVNHYTAARRLRSDDAYTPGGKAGFRPDNASVVYCRLLKQLFPHIPVVLGGVEASMRRITYYDYWEDRVRPSVLLESGADLLLYGMAENPLHALLDRIGAGVPFGEMKDIPQSVFRVNDRKALPEPPATGDLELPGHEALAADTLLFAKTFAQWEKEINKGEQRRMLQPTDQGWLVVNPEAPRLTENELDAIYDLPYTRLPHPKYSSRGDIPAFEMIKHSITLHRGCFGGCSFCTLAAHQGKHISSRSAESVMREVDKIAGMEGFKGHISDLGGPSANMYRMEPVNADTCRRCSRPSCIYPSVCRNLSTDHRPLIKLYRQVRSHPAVRKATIGSGVRYDLFMYRKGQEADAYGHSQYLSELVTYHVSGRLKVAPEHTSPRVLALMRKPSFDLFVRLKDDFDKICRKQGMQQQIIPYFISSHPGSEEADMKDLASRTRQLGLKLEQVQDFTPTPLTLANTMYYTGLNPDTLQPVYVARNSEEKQRQRGYFFWYKEKSRHTQVALPGMKKTPKDTLHRETRRPSRPRR